MKRRLPGIVLVLAIVTLASYSVACGSEIPGNAVAKVGDTYISAETFDAAVAEEAANSGITKELYPEYFVQLQKWVARNLVTNELANLEATRLGLSVTDADVQAQMDLYLQSYYGGDQATFDAALTTAGLTLEEFKANVKAGLLRDKVQAEVVKDITSVPEADITAYYEANKASYYVEPSREVRHILIKPETSGTASAPTTTGASGTTATTSGATVAVSTEADWAKALTTAKEVRRRLTAGGSWTTLASQYSDDFQTKDTGGDMGVIKQGANIKEFEDAAFALGLNEISQPVRTVYGYEIIQATVITKGGQQTLEEKRSDIEAILLSQAKDEAWNAWVDGKETELGVIYRSDLRPTPPTTTESTTTTATSGSSTTSSSSATTTTVKP